MSPEVVLDSRHALFRLAVDDLEWTRHWLGKRRCDSLLVWVATSDSVHPRIHIRAVESKASTSTDPVEPSTTNEPFRKGYEQVIETLAALARALNPGGRHQLVEDLRFASFIEHLASVALAQFHPIAPGESEKGGVIATINSLSTRQLGDEDIVLDGVVICTQYRTGTERKAIRVEGGTEADGGPWPVFLVRCGSQEVDNILGEDTSELVVRASQPDDTSEEDGQEQERTAARSQEEAREEEPRDAAGDEEPEAGATEESTDGLDDVEQLARNLYLACRQRGIPVDEPDYADITRGPSLLSVPMPLASGASIRPIESSLEDLAREVAVSSVDVENDPERAYHIRFLVARPDRQFPSLPDTAAPLVDPEDLAYQGFYLGRTLEGDDFLSFMSSWPHMLVSGTTGSGKTTFIQSLLRQLGSRPSETVSVAIIDGKGEFDYYEILDESFMTSEFPEVQLGHQRVTDVLDWVMESEIPSRRDVMKAIAEARGGPPPPARTLFVESANSDEGIVQPFPPLLIVIDEFAEIMQGPEAQTFERRIQQIAQIGRSSLVHLVMATQRPDASVIKGAIKANLDARVALRLPTHHDSMTVLGGKGAEKLLGNGDLIFQSSGHPRIRLQGYRPST